MFAYSIFLENFAFHAQKGRQNRQIFFIVSRGLWNVFQQYFFWLFGKADGAQNLPLLCRTIGAFCAVSTPGAPQTQAANAAKHCARALHSTCGSAATAKNAKSLLCTGAQWAGRQLPLAAPVVLFAASAAQMARTESVFRPVFPQRARDFCTYRHNFALILLACRHDPTNRIQRL